MKVSSAVLILCMAVPSAISAQASDVAKTTAYLKTLPPVTPPVFDEAKREMLAASAISCTDRPEESPANRNNYLWQYAKAPQILDGYDKNRSFFGCANWHDAVGSIWMLMSIWKQDPKITLATDIKDIATTHFRASNVEGEYNFFATEKPQPGASNFERPYGYAWLLKLYGEVKGSNSPDAKKMTTALTPLAKWMSERYVFYLYNLKFPFRSGTETNTAWSMGLALDGANLSEDTTLKTAIHDNALRLFGKDKSCAAVFEPQNSDMVSSCLTEAALMGRVMDQASYLKWLDAYLPPVYSDAFQGYAKDIDVSHTDTSGADAQVQLIAKANLIGLSFQRATSLMVITHALPKDDPRIAIFKNLAAMNAKHGYEKINLAGYEGQHWLATFALLYENAMKGPAPLGPPEKPKGPDGKPKEAEEN